MAAIVDDLTHQSPNTNIQYVDYVYWQLLRAADDPCKAIETGGDTSSVQLGEQCLHAGVSTLCHSTPAEVLNSQQA